MKIKKRNLQIGIIVIAIIAVFLVIKLQAPEYPDIRTPKDVFGNPDADVRIEEFSDLQCPACQAAHVIVKKIKAEFKENISFTYYHFPLSYHEYAFKAAEAAECANDQGKFWPFIDIAFSRRGELAKKNLIEIAEVLDLDKKSFAACIDSGAKKDLVEEDILKGHDIGVGGTPSFYINGKKLDSFKYENFKEAILAELE